ncbi:hypothetical protein F5148DRAFT_1273072 [Russula earlei]|uniref:Uncharacterized protein n=1 Tax=Russula earlei TaxID=71964 RepID=A0ACC0UP23_9AGAM|nr:hypothetical protein F5148DRAFT_1273072 [Russula earlei]
MLFGLGLFLLAGAIAAPVCPDPCAAIAGSLFSKPADALACLRSFPFNETLRQNVMSTVSRVFDFYTFENYYPKSTAPFPNDVHIRNGLSRINSTSYVTDYDFNRDLYRFVNQLNDGHTLWLPNCYVTWEALLPTPVVSVSVDGMEDVYIAPDIDEFISLLPDGFASYYESIDFNWKRLAGARVLRIEGMPSYEYVAHVADTVTGTYLDHGLRENSVFTSYRLIGTSYSQKFGDLAGRVFDPIEDLTIELIPVGESQAEIVTVPFLDVFLGNSFSDRDSYWANNCAANDNTNGADRRSKSGTPPSYTRLRAKGITRFSSNAIGLPAKFQPSLPPVNVNASEMFSYLLPDGVTGVLFVGSFQDDDHERFQRDVTATITALKAAGAVRLLIDLTNNPGGFISHFSRWLYLSGFQSAIRGNLLARKIVKQLIAQGISEDLSFYVIVNGRKDVTSLRFYDACPFSVPIPSLPPFDLTVVAIVTNGNCASTCALFSTLMKERHNTTIAVFGGRPGQSIEFKGVAGNQVLEWTDLDSEIKTAGLKNDPLAPPDLHNWRTAYSYLDEDAPIAYYSEPPSLRFPYTADTYNDPQNLWIFA